MAEYVIGEAERRRGREILYMIYEKARDTRGIENAHLERGVFSDRSDKSNFEWVKVLGKGKKRLLGGNELTSLSVLYAEGEIIVERLYTTYGDKRYKTEVLYKKHVLRDTEDVIVSAVVNFMRNYFSRMESKGFLGKINTS